MLDLVNIMEMKRHASPLQAGSQERPGNNTGILNLIRGVMVSKKICINREVQFVKQP